MMAVPPCGPPLPGAGAERAETARTVAVGKVPSQRATVAASQWVSTMVTMRRRLRASVKTLFLEVAMAVKGSHSQRRFQ